MNTQIKFLSNLFWKVSFFIDFSFYLDFIDPDHDLDLDLDLDHDHELGLTNDRS